eukprot:CAMPEP_0114571862 /NCGR_PEP_ID=MMETSP0114-20121206/17964_1 /TAXON_ID=31324 /ORGANISM="Goniomonas sp, Strain m" /LENGTH=144 /DNA_ID=CAMNT_0001758993 /DNA_START=274 /DNA_END=704 /DNA_ORIENTATION=-
MSAIQTGKGPLNNCVGFLNQKYFVLFVTYAVFACAIAVLVLVRELLRENDVMDTTLGKVLMSNVVLVGVAGLCCLGLMVFQWELVLKNTTSIEHAKHSRGLYDVGARANYRQVMGSLLCCLCPFGKPEGDGTTWTVRRQHLHSA